jgi:hypothetical protein
MISTTSSASLRAFATAALVGTASLLPAAVTRAADLAPAPAATPTLATPMLARDWALTITPYMWASSLKGDAALYGLPARVDVPFSQTLKEMQFGVMGAADLRIGKFGAYINGEYAKVASDKHLSRLTLGVGMKNYLISGGVYYRLYEAALGGDTVFGKPRVFAIEPTAGLRWSSLETKVRRGNIALSMKQDWLDPFVGTRVTYDISDRWNFAMEADIGGFGVGTRLSVNAQAAIGYRTTMLGVPTTLRAGYRVLHQDYRDGNFQWKVTQYGPIFGAAMQF